MKTPFCRATRRGHLLILPLVLLLAACGGGDGSSTPTATPGPDGVIDDAPRPDGGFNVLTQVIALNGCRVTFPMSWISYGDGYGESPSGARFAITSGQAGTDASWDAAVKLVVDQAARQNATVERGHDFVLETRPDDRGFTYRTRVDNRYCDVSVTSQRAIPEGERDQWEPIMASVQGAPETLAQPSPTATTSGG
jgi:hypothetical protein